MRSILFALSGALTLCVGCRRDAIPDDMSACPVPTQSGPQLEVAPMPTSESTPIEIPKYDPKYHARTDIKLVEEMLKTPDRYIIVTPDEVKHLVGRKGTWKVSAESQSSPDRSDDYLVHSDPELVRQFGWLLVVSKIHPGPSILVPHGHSFVPLKPSEYGRRRWLPLEGEWPPEDPDDVADKK